MQAKGKVIATLFSYVATTSTVIWEKYTQVFVSLHLEYLTVDEMMKLKMKRLL